MSINVKTIFLSAFFAVSLGLNAMSAFAQTGLFWKAEAPDRQTIYLFGTIHSDDNRVAEFSPAVVDAIKSSEAFMMETLQPTDPSALMNMNKLDVDLSTEEMDQVNQLADFHTMPREVALQMKPWLLAVIFDSPRPLTPFSQDNLLMRQAEDFGKEVIGIEDTQEHFGVMDDFSREEQLTMLRAVLKRTQSQKEQDFERLVAAYLAQDTDALLKLDSEITGGMLPNNIWQKMKTKLMTDRNVLMAERVIDEAKQKNVFVAVGAAHLAGDDGLVSRIKAAGYTIKTVH